MGYPQALGPRLLAPPPVPRTPTFHRKGIAVPKWELSHDDILHLPIKKGQLPKGESGEVVSFRLDPRMLRRISEIVEQRQFIAIGTKSDFFRWCCEIGLKQIQEMTGDTSLIAYFASMQIDEMRQAEQEVAKFIEDLGEEIRRNYNDVGKMRFLRKIAEEYCEGLSNESVTDEVMRLF